MNDPIRPLTDLEKLEDEAMLLLAGSPTERHLVNWAPIRRAMNKKVLRLMADGSTRREALRQIIKGAK